MAIIISTVDVKPDQIMASWLRKLVREDSNYGGDTTYGKRKNEAVSKD